MEMHNRAHRSFKWVICALMRLESGHALPSQDSVRGGKPGNRKMCVAAARRGLAAGSNIIVDRTNFDADQRADFIQLGRSMGAQVPSSHAYTRSGRTCPEKSISRRHDHRRH